MVQHSVQYNKRQREENAPLNLDRDTYRPLWEAKCWNRVPAGCLEFRFQILRR